MAVEEHGYSVYIYQARGTKAVSLDSHLGTRRPMHATATGKSMLSHLDTDAIDDIIDRHGLATYTANTIDERDSLLTELTKIREQGYAIDDGELIDGMRAVAAPIVPDGSKEVVGSLAVTGPRNHITDSRLRTEMPETVMEIARTAGIEFTYS